MQDRSKPETRNQLWRLNFPRADRNPKPTAKVGFNRRNPKPETRNRQRKLVSSDETRNPKPETDSESWFQSTKPETRNPKPTRIRLLGGSPDRNSFPGSDVSPHTWWTSGVLASGSSRMWSQTSLSMSDPRTPLEIPGSVLPFRRQSSAWPVGLSSWPRSSPGRLPGRTSSATLGIWPVAATLTPSDRLGTLGTAGGQDFNSWAHVATDLAMDMTLGKASEVLCTDALHSDTCWSLTCLDSTSTGGWSRGCSFTHDSHDSLDWISPAT